MLIDEPSELFSNITKTGNHKQTELYNGITSSTFKICIESSVFLVSLASKMAPLLHFKKPHNAEH